MKISALAPWFGSKRTLAPLIVEELGPHRAFWDVMCGSCSVLFAKPRCSHESVNDLHKDLLNLALVLQDEDSARILYGKMDRTLFHEDMLPIAKLILSAQPPPEQGDTARMVRAYWYLVFSWMGLNGVAGTPLHHTGTFAVRYSTRGGNGATRWRSVIESIPDWHERLQNVQILSRDAFLILEDLADEAGTAIYVDPPYIDKGATYVHDFKPDDHDRLAGLLRRFTKARVVLSYYEHPRLHDLYPDWTIRDCTLMKSMVSSGIRESGTSKEAPERLIVNGESYAKRTLFS